MAGGASAGALLGLASGAQAAQFTVSNTLDSGPGSLRQAVDDAEGNPGTDEIIFSPAARGTITLTTGELDISDGLTIAGPGAAELTVSGNDASPIFDFNSLGFGRGFDISGLHLTHGSGGGGEGGAITATGSSKLRLSEVLIDESASGDLGGAILDFLGLLVIEDSTITGNEAVSAGGIGMYAGVTRIKRSTISGNEAEEAGGGLVLGFGSATIENSTISGNTSNTGGGGSTIPGGGVLSYGELEMVIESSTITGNAAPGTSGGGIASAGDAEGPVLHNSIVAGNHAALGPDLYTYGQDAGPFTASFSLIGTTAGAQVEQPVPGSNLIGEGPHLLPLDDNGGPTRTHAIGVGSPARNAGDPDDFPETDQRGLPRPQSFAPDMGAFELEDTAPPRTRIDKQPPRTLRTTNTKRKVKLRFSTKEAGSTFECRLRGGKERDRSWRPCRSPQPYLLEAARGDGKHYEFKVRATDATGNRDPKPATARWRIVRTG